MLLVKGRILILLTVFVHSVTCSAVDSNEDRVKKLSLPDTSLSSQSDQEVKFGLQETTEDNVMTTIAEITEATTKPASNDVAKDIKRTKSKFTQIQTEFQIPVAVIYDTTVTPTRRVGHRTRTGRYRKIGRPHESRHFEAKLQDSLSERYEVTTFRPQNNGSIPVTAETSTKLNPTKTTKKIQRQKDPVVPIIVSDNHVYSHKGEFHYSYESGDGTVAFERGSLKKTDAENREGESVEGGFSYTDKDGNDFSLSYTADENGYRPNGAHLPTPPPIPPAIARALKYLATKPTEEPVTYSYIDYV